MTAVVGPRTTFERRAAATRPDAWPEFLAPAYRPAAATSGVDDVDEPLEDLDAAIARLAERWR